jgi:hypothetical protein
MNRKYTPFSGSRREILLILLSYFVLVGISLIANNIFLVVFLTLFYLLFLCLKPRNYSFLALAFVVLFIWTTSLLDAFTLIRDASLRTLSDPALFFNNLFTPKTGLTDEVLDRPELWMLEKINKFDLKDYKLTPPLEDRDTFQSMVESAWPIKMESDSRNIFIKARDLDAYAKCKIIDKNEELALVHCP